MQQQLFPTDNKSKNKGLTITKAGKQKLSKNQDAFNKLTKKIEALQKEIEKKQLQLDLALKIYGSELYPAQLKVAENRQKMIMILWDIYKSYRLSKTDQRHLKYIIQFHLQAFFSESETEPDESIQKIFSELEGVSYDKMIQDEKEKFNAEMQQAFDELNVDIEGVDLNDGISMEKKIAEARQKIADNKARQEERERQRQAKKKKSAKQLESEKMQKAIDEMKQKNISTIYKQLAKLFHPDLEQDAERKLEKEIMMKELTAAYEAKNLHALLTLELKWIHKETDHLESLTEEKLAIYLQILKEQAGSLEREKYTLLQQPQYAVLANEFGFEIQANPAEVLRRRVKTTMDMARDFENDIADFEGNMALRNVKEMIKDWKNQQQKEFSQEDLITMFFK